MQKFPGIRYLQLNLVKLSARKTIHIRRSWYPIRRIIGDFMFSYEVLWLSLDLDGKDEVEKLRLVD